MRRRLSWRSFRRAPPFTGSRNTFYLDPRHPFAVHFGDGESQIPKPETLTALGDESELIQHKPAHSGIGRVFRQGNAILRVQIPHIQGSVKDHRTIGQRQRLLYHIKLVVNLADHLFQHILERYQAQQTSELVHHHRHPCVVFLELLQQLSGRLGFRRDEHFPQNPPQIKGLQRHAFLDPPLPILQNPQHILYVHKSKDVVDGPAIHGNPRFLRGGKHAQHLVERRLHREQVHIRPRHHNLAHLHLSHFDGAQNKSLFARSQQPPLSRLLYLDLQFLGRVRHAVP